MERPDDGRRRRTIGEPVIDCVDQHADPEDIGEQDEFLALFRRKFPGPGEPFHGHQPFVLLQIHVTRKTVKVLDQRLHDLPQSRGVASLPLLQRKIGQIFLGSIRHWNLPP